MGHKIGKIFLGIMAISILGWVFFFWKKPSTTLPIDTSVIQSEDKFFNQQEPKDGFRVYQNLLFHFSLQIPEELGLREYSQGDTSTLVFEDEKGEKGFQIFIVPYTGMEIDEKRMKMDLPRGVKDSGTEGVIDGIPARFFESENSLFGSMREVWFIHNGFLYEVSTFKDLDPWLADILATWKFLSL